MSDADDTAPVDAAVAEINPADAAALREMREADAAAKLALDAHWHHIREAAAAYAANDAAAYRRRLQQAADAHDAHLQARSASLDAFRRYNDLMDQTGGPR